MTLAHLIYIPGVILVGAVVGYLMGARAVRAEFEKQKARAKQ
jgi:proteasome assembly chaperone (PAC2) family protein